jgi:hypothetical protein
MTTLGLFKVSLRAKYAPLYAKIKDKRNCVHGYILAVVFDRLTQFT